MGEYKRLTNLLFEMREKYKELSVWQGKYLSRNQRKERDRLGRKIGRLDRMLKRADAAIGKRDDRVVGNYYSALTVKKR